MYMYVVYICVWQTDVFLKTYQHEGLQVNTKKETRNNIIGKIGNFCKCIM